MHAKRGVTSFYYGFRRYLGMPEVKSRVCPLQFTGRLEDYLVKEFVSYIVTASGGLRFAEVNQGLSGQQKVDIAILRAGDQVEALIEAKYLMNRHRRSRNIKSAMDELSTSLGGLRRQLALIPGRSHGFRELRLSARSARVYGLVFASYTMRRDEPDLKDEFFTRILQKAAAYGMRYHDLPRPYLRSAYEDEEIDLLSERWWASLRLGLWRL
jgi:hypothetical protein